MAKGKPEWASLQQSIQYEILSDSMSRARKLPVSKVGVQGRTSRIEAITYPRLTPLLQEQPLAARRVNSARAIDCAHHVSAYAVHYRQQFGVLLRPIRPKDTVELTEEDILECYGVDFPRRRTQAIRDLLEGQRSRVLLMIEETLMACLAPQPPKLSAYEPQGIRSFEMEIIRLVRQCDLPVPELRREMMQWIQKLQGKDVESHTTQVLSKAETRLLEILRDADPATLNRVLKVMGTALTVNDLDR